MLIAVVGEWTTVDRILSVHTHRLVPASQQFLNHRLVCRTCWTDRTKPGWLADEVQQFLRQMLAFNRVKPVVGIAAYVATWRSNTVATISAYIKMRSNLARAVANLHTGIQKVEMVTTASLNTGVGKGVSKKLSGCL